MSFEAFVNDCISDSINGGSEPSGPPRLQLGLTWQQKELRRNKIGASNTPGILRLSPWSSPIEEWLKIVDPDALGKTMTDAMVAGHLFESGLLAWFQDEMAVTVTAGWTMQHPDFDFIVATPDGTANIDGDLVPVECKVVSPRQAEKWTDGDGLVRAPDYVRVQSLHQQAVMLAPYGYVVAVVFGWDGVTLHKERVEQVGDLTQAALVERLVEFHRDHIATGVPPAASASAGEKKALGKLHPTSNGTLLEPSPDDVSMAAKRAALQRVIADSTKTLDELDNQMRQRIGDAEGIRGIATWTSRKGSISYAKAVKAAALDAEFLETFRGEPSRILRWEVE